MAQQVGNHHQDGYNQSLEEDVKAHAAREDAFLRITGLALHDVCLALLHSKGQGREAVGNQVDPEQVHRLQDRKANQGREEDRQHLGQVGGQKELDGFADVRVNPASFLYRRHDGGEIIVRQNHVSHVLRYVGSGDTHADADVRALDGGRVVYAVSGHGRDHALGLPALYDADLMLRLHAGVYGKLLNPAAKFFIIHLVQLGACDGLVRAGDNAKLHTDGHCRILVVSGNHNRPDAGLTTFYDGRLDLRTDRIDHAGKSDVGQILLQEFRLRIGGNRIPVPLCAAEHAQGLVCHGLVGSQDGGLHLLCHGDTLSALNRVGTALEHLVGRSLCILYDVSVRSLMNGRHHLTHGIEGSLSHAGIRFLQLCLLIAILRRVVDQGALGGLAHSLAGLRVPFRVGTEGHADLQLLFIVRHMLHDGHLVLGQGTGLIRADNLRTSQRLHSRQLADDGVALRHVRHADGKHDGHHGCQSLRNRRHRQGNRYHKGIQNRVSADAGPKKSYRENHHADSHYQHGQNLAELVQLQLQRSLFVLGLGQGGGDLTHLRMHTGSRNHGLAASVHYCGTHVNHVLAVAQRNVLLALQLQKAHQLVDRHRLSCQGRLLNLHAGTFDDTSVGRHRVARLQHHDIARNQLFALERNHLAIAHHLAGCRRNLLQGRDSRFRLALLDYAQHRVDDNHGHDDDNVRKGLSLIGRRNTRDDSRYDQDDDHRICQLI